MKIGFANQSKFCSVECRKAHYKENQHKTISKKIRTESPECNKIISANKICNGADGNCNQCPYDGIRNCTEKLAKDTIKLLVSYRDKKETTESFDLQPTIKMKTGNFEDGLITEIKKQEQIYSTKKKTYKKGTMLHQYWLGKEEAVKQIINLLNGY